MAKMVEEVFPTLHGLVPTIEVQTNSWKFVPTPILVEIVSTPIGGIWFQGQLVEITPRPIGVQAQTLVQVQVQTLVCLPSQVQT